MTDIVRRAQWPEQSAIHFSTVVDDVTKWLQVIAAGLSLTKTLIDLMASKKKPTKRNGRRQHRRRK